MSTDHSRTYRRRSRQWYHVGGLVDDYQDALETGDGELKMLKALTVLRSILVIVAISAISAYALFLGADPTTVAVLALPSIAVYGGVEVADYAALIQAYREIKSGEVVDNSPEADQTTDQDRSRNK